MWKRVAVFGILLVAVTAAGVREVAAKSPDEAAIRQVWKDYSAAVNARDLNRIMSFYAANVLAFDAFPPRQYVGREAYKKDYAGFFAEFPGPVRADISDVHVEASGDLAYATGIDRWTIIDKKGKKSEMVFRATDVFRRINGKWLIIHEHVSFPVNPETGMGDMLSR